ncbi:carbon-nitrogen family hydrolase [Alkalihalobacillus oceani]|uniref:Carbon-nitrogen family hydrolase n=1 Tax=Halalkalibacter oceani TaxID=1653776 RepID=A0A9X2DVP0_9BACI|nr:carbon-nitrogen family hydrolase [Halalkalibacter oceani]MCM3716188.1 carbon-nitrogen family hydrolase [Halalkalibacter oceani]
MKMALYQMEIIPGNPGANREKVRRWAHDVMQKEQPELLVLPEMWTTAYTLESLSDILTEDGDQTEPFLQELASSLHVPIVAGSIAVKEEEQIFNRAFVINEQGQTVYHYDKIHLVPMLDEPNYLTGGRNPVKVFEVTGRKMGLVICYDLRFPELFRSLALQGAEVIFVLAEWPMARIHHWEVLQQARAIENQVFIVSCNCVNSYDGVEFAGTSLAINPWGEIVAKGSKAEEETITATLPLHETARIRKEVPVFSSRVPDLY